MLNKFLIDSKDFDGSVLVTGAGGCIGSWVLALLIKSEIDVVAFDISDNKSRREQSGGGGGEKTKKAYVQV